MYSDEDLLPLSALQHFLFCERQCALIHIEQVWAENVYTIEGELLHKRAHSADREKRPGKRTEFGMPIRSSSSASQARPTPLNMRLTDQSSSSSTSGGTPRGETRMRSSFARKQCVWRKCAASRS